MLVNAAKFTLAPRTRRPPQAPPVPAAMAAGSGPAAWAPVKLALYDDPHSLYCAKVKIAMHAKALQVTTLDVPCGSTKSTEYQSVVSLAKIPALLVDYGSGQQVVVQESEVISEFIEDTFPQPALLPAHPLLRAQVRLLARFHDLYLEPALRALYPAANPAQRHPAAVAAAVAAVEAQLAALERLLEGAAAAEAQVAAAGQAGPGHAPGSSSSGPQGAASGPGAASSTSPSPSQSPPAGQAAPPQGGAAYAVGGRLSLADCAYPAFFFYAELLWPELLGRPGPDYDGLGLGRVAAWRQALWADPHVRAVLASLAPAGEEWLQGKLEQGRAQLREREAQRQQQQAAA